MFLVPWTRNSAIVLIAIETMQIPSMINICSKTVGKLPDAYKVINNPAILIIAPINIPGILDLFFRRRLKITTTKALQ
ncbi:MAG: hypothetical protein WBB21_08345 [Saprospiraceae bacterium]